MNKSYHVVISGFEFPEDAETFANMMRELGLEGLSFNVMSIVEETTVDMSFPPQYPPYGDIVD